MTPASDNNNRSNRSTSDTRYIPGVRKHFGKFFLSFRSLLEACIKAVGRIFEKLFNIIQVSSYFNKKVIV